MTAATRPGTGAFGAVLGYTLRACLPARRWWTLALPCVAAVCFGLLSRLSDEPADEAFATVADVGLFSLLIPIACLVIGDAVLGAELRAGTFHFTWLSPAPVRTIVVGRWLGGWIVSPRDPRAGGGPGRGRGRQPGERAGHRRGHRRRISRLRRVCSCSSAAWPAGPRCGRWPSSSSSSGCWARR